MSRFSEEESPSLTGISEIVTSMLMGNLGGKVFFLTPAAFYRLQMHDELCALGQNILLEEIIHPLLGEKEKKVNIFKYFYEEAQNKRSHETWARKKGKIILHMCPQPAPAGHRLPQHHPSL